ncbi:DNA-(apurinic or apyrimidinic site) lyase 2 [Acipenser oxyrinchus oxyrinchus]|uniref:DNA-(apurinic or apyrimidinic site) endonuclease n=1 Tax=Acipenser oxyrinchus oxyrinchus TaxID=40147 RepID=A0AAD8CHQ3_ACIOX|nr:DNA-(apurinic or apyrimidinic site) lyase 2 [Acipenser oxyrinchus oxyrinchus]
MRIVTWNINGIRTFKGKVKQILDSLDADIICVQETKVTRDLLDERTAIVEGYSSYFSFSRGRSGYSGVATFCKDSATPFAAEEGLTGLLTSQGGAVGSYGNREDFSDEELQSLDNEGRAVITQHKIRSSGGGEETLAVINVYCPRADPEKPERKLFKLRFYQLLQIRAEAILETGSHVIVLGDVNTSHRSIDHCDPDDPERFDENPGRKWLNEFLFGSSEGEEKADEEETGVIQEPKSQRPAGASGGKFVDTFRYFHPSQTHAFTCWLTLTGARQTNYGTRIDYIFANRKLVDSEFLDSKILPEVEGSDHCRSCGELRCVCLRDPKCPPLCTKHMPEFAGRQQKLSRFLVKAEHGERKELPKEVTSFLPGSQESGEIRENIRPGKDLNLGKRGQLANSSSSSSSKSKKAKTANSKTGQRGSLLAFFKPKPSQEAKNKDLVIFGKTAENSAAETQKDLGTTTSQTAVQESQPAADSSQKNGPEQVMGDGSKEAPGVKDIRPPQLPESEGSPGFWKSILRGPPPPPNCKAHGEPCVLRTVKKAGPNFGKRFFVCARPQGHASNPEARCNFFVWVGKGK